MHRGNIRLAGLAIGLLAGTLLVSTLLTAATAAPPTPTVSSGQSDIAPTPSVPPPGSPRRSPFPPGSVAIHPHLSAASPTQAAFTVQDVVDYLTPLYTAANQPFSVAKIEFITAGGISARLNGEDIGVSSDTLVCVVTVNTTYTTVIGPPAARQSFTFHHVIQIFDAHTGNELMDSYSA